MRIIAILFIIISLLSCSTQEQSDWTNLLDSDLSQWDTYLSYRHEVGYDGKLPEDQDSNPIPPIGLNKDNDGVFGLVKEKKELVLRVSVEIYGCIFTKEEFENYHFTLKVKWGDKKWIPRMDLLKDSGILYHSIGPLGAEHWRSWMLSQEFQIMEGHMGDYWSQATSAIDIRAYIPEYIMNPVADQNQGFVSIGTGEEIQGFCLRSNNLEKPHGEWNKLELICFEDKSIHIVNGEVVMVLDNSRYLEDGNKIPMNKGKIQLQSEAAEVFFKDIKIKPLDSLPEMYNHLYKH